MSPLKISITKEGQPVEQIVLRRGEEYQKEVAGGIGLIADPDTSSIPGLDADAWDIYCTDSALAWQGGNLDQVSMHKAYVNDIHPRAVFSYDTVFELEANWIPENE